MASCMVDNLDYTGEKVSAWVFKENAEECQKECAFRAHCRFFTYVKREKHCHLRKAIGDMRWLAKNDGHWNNVVSGPSQCKGK